MPIRGKHKKASKKVSKPARKSLRSSVKKSAAKQTTKIAPNPSPVMSVQLAGSRVLPPLNVKESRVFSIEIGSISGETTIGDLIVAFPRTRDVLMKHGLRFDVEEAGYLYMTLNVFSAINGVTSNNLIEELHTASKEPAEQTAQTVRPLLTPPVH